MFWSSFEIFRPPYQIRHGKSNAINSTSSVEEPGIACPIHLNGRNEKPLFFIPRLQLTSALEASERDEALTMGFF
jgi:hypothetical protein